MIKKESSYSLYFMMVGAMIIWGLSWTNAKILGTYTDPLILMFWRFVIAGFGFLPILPFIKKSLKLNKENFFFVILNAFFITLYNYFYFKGTQIGLAGAGGVLVTTLNPIFTFLFTLLIYNKTASKKDIIGVLMGLTGGGLIMNIWNFSLNSLLVSGNLYFLLCALSWVFVTLITSKSKTKIHIIPFSFWSFSISAIFTVPFITNLPIMEVFQFDIIFWTNFLMVSIGSMTLATTIYFLGTTQLGSEKASAFIFTVPVSAMGFSIIFLGEKLELFTVIGGIFAITAVYLINRNPEKDTAIE